MARLVLATVAKIPAVYSRVGRTDAGIEAWMATMRSASALTRLLPLAGLSWMASRGVD
jgi:hypothetical protein